MAGANELCDAVTYVVNTESVKCLKLAVCLIITWFDHLSLSTEYAAEELASLILLTI